MQKVHPLLCQILTLEPSHPWLAPGVTTWNQSRGSIENSPVLFVLLGRVGYQICGPEEFVLKRQSSAFQVETHEINLKAAVLIVVRDDMRGGRGGSRLGAESPQGLLSESCNECGWRSIILDRGGQGDGVDSLDMTNS